MSKNRNDKESMIYLMPRASKIISEIFGISLWSTSCPDLKLLDFAIWGVLENKTNATSNLNIGSLKTVIEKRWNQMSEEFILKPYNLYRRHDDTMIKKKDYTSYRMHVVYIHAYIHTYIHAYIPPSSSSLSS